MNSSEIEEEDNVCPKGEGPRHEHVRGFFLMAAAEVAKNVFPIGALRAGGAHDLLGSIR